MSTLVNTAQTTIAAAQAQKEVVANGNFDILDRVAAATSVTVVNGTNNLTEEDCQYGLVLLTGTITAVATVVIPSTLLKRVKFINLTAGNFTITVKHSGQTGATLKYNEMLDLWPTHSQGQSQRNHYNRKTIAMSAANYTATDDDCWYDMLEVTGAIGAGRNFSMFPNIHRFTFYNNTTGGFAVTVKTTAGTGIAVAATKRQLLECDGTNIVAIAASI